MRSLPSRRGAMAIACMGNGSPKPISRTAWTNGSSRPKLSKPAPMNPLTPQLNERERRYKRLNARNCRAWGIFGLRSSANLELRRKKLVVLGWEVPGEVPGGTCRFLFLPGEKRRLLNEIHIANNDDKTYCGRIER